MQFRLSLLTCCLSAGALAACGSNAPASIAPPQQSNIATATPYPQPPVPTIVDASGAVSGSSGSGGITPKEVTYRVEAGDTLLAIANKFDTTVEAIVKRNSITNPADLKIGQDLIIPTTSTVLATATPAPTGTARPTATATPTATPRPAATASPTPTVSAGGGLTYTVQSGDTSFDIAARFGITVEELAQANNRTVASLANLQIGDRLIIPAAR